MVPAGKGMMPKPGIGPVAAFRVDSSVRIGSGHVMRCLTLADELKRRGWQCHFLTRDFPGTLIGQIGAAGHMVHLLAAPKQSAAVMTGYAAWLGVTQDDDSKACAGVLERLRPDLLVVDHYALDAAWEKPARDLAAHVVVIDDLADRAHDCDLLLDQTLGRTADAYDGLVPTTARVLGGAHYALLRHQFAECRAASLEARRERTPSHLLIAVGGHDHENITGRLLRALALRAPEWLTGITVILGSGAPALEQARTFAEAMPVPTSVLTDVTDMAAHMVLADVAVGGAGTSSWERCALGLPTLLVVVAENQRMVAEALTKAGAAELLDASDDGHLPDRLTRALDAFGDDAWRRKMSRRAAGVNDGRGTVRVCDRIAAMGLSVRRATEADALNVMEWRNAVPDIRFYRSAARPTRDDHMRWFVRALSDPARILLIVEDRGGRIGHVRLDRPELGAASADVSLCLAPMSRGQHLAAPALLAALDAVSDQGIDQVRAEVHCDNLASVRLFEGLDFAETGQSGDFRQYAITLTDQSKGARTL
jgi:UDP-2,4-diacetamido-2,4,6-trideoxy-beta-L-altropyranose hydrolase